MTVEARDGLGPRLSRAAYANDSCKEAHVLNGAKSAADAGNGKTGELGESPLGTPLGLALTLSASQMPLLKF